MSDRKSYLKNYMKKYRIIHRDFLLKQMRDNYHKNKEKRAIYFKEYSKTEKYKQSKHIRDKIYRLKNKEKLNKYMRNYIKTPKGKLIKTKLSSKRKKLFDSIPLKDNPFDEEEIITWHHINNTYVLAVPHDLHILYAGDRKKHRENMKPIIEQIYGCDIYV